jgi:RND family efflux transporter MFP subunit
LIRPDLKHSSCFFRFLIIIILCSCSREEQGTEYKLARDVSAVKIEETCEKAVVESFGTLKFRKKADITSAVDGIIKEIFFDEGDRVTAGAELATVTNIQLNIRLEQAEAALFSAESAWKLSQTQYREGIFQVESRLIALEKSRLILEQKKRELSHQSNVLDNKKKLLALGGITSEEILSLELTFSALETEVFALKKDISIQNIGFRDKDINEMGLTIPFEISARREVLLDINTRSLKAELQVAEARIKSVETELRSAEVLLEEMHLNTPIQGIVGARYQETGERVQADSKLFTIFDSSEIDLVFQVPEKIGVLLCIDQKVDLTIDAVPGTNYYSVIRFISPTVDPGSGNITIKALIENSNGKLRPGMFARLSLAYGSERRLLRIPSECLVHKDGNRGLVFRIIEGRVYPVSLTIGDERMGLIEIIDGIKAGDSIVESPSPLLQEGDEVNVQ